MALFEARHLHKRFGDRVVLEDIDLAFEEGTLTGIMGPNGAGKTTCFNCLTGMYSPDRGEIVFDGTNIAGFTPPAITRRGVARSFQAINLFNDDTALDNLVVALPAMRARSFDAWRDRSRDGAAEDRAAALLERVGLKGRERVRAKDLAYGERRALEIGLALATSPRILFLDEPTSGVDPITRREFWRRIDAMAEAGVTVLVTSHFMDEAEYCDRLGVIYRGRLIALGDPDSIKRQHADGEEATLEDAFVAMIEAYDREHAA